MSAYTLPDAGTAAAATERAQASRRWIAGTLGGVALLVSLNLLLSWRMDVFGVLRSSAGHALVTAPHERKAKYLLNGNYVPQNFDALVIGASASANWHVNQLTGFRFYNESLDGGNGSEERMLVEHALARGHFRLALVGLYPTVLQSHALQDGFDQVSTHEAFGSLTAFTLELRTLRADVTHAPARWFPDGAHELPGDPAPPKADDGSPPIRFELDPQSVADYRALIFELQRHGVRVVYFRYPTFQPYLEMNRAAFDAFDTQMQQALPAAPVLDMDGPAFAALRRDPDNFMDLVHLTPAGP